MDTRAKILSREAARNLRGQCPRLKVVTGNFDPLLAAHARRLEQLRAPEETLLVVVTDPRQPLLPARARAELVAALRVVDCVVIAAEDLEGWLGSLQPDELIREEAADEVRRNELIRHVLNRRQAP